VRLYPRWKVGKQKPWLRVAPDGNRLNVTMIADLALLSDCRSAAVVDRSGSVLWWSPDRFDAPAWFAGLLGPGGGAWSLTPTGVIGTRRAYLGDSLVLRTTFTTSTGVLQLTEGLLFATGARGHEIGRESPASLVRALCCLEGEVEVKHRFAPRVEYGRGEPRFERRDPVVSARASDGILSLFPALDLAEAEEGLVGEWILRAGERRAFACVFGPGMPLADPERALDDTILGWGSWVEAHDRPEGLYAERVALAARVLQGLTHQETGAVLAAPTTSLPEIPGGSANWDYRYGWLRDSSLVAHALRRATCADETERYLDWMAEVAHDGDDLGETQALFGLAGERLLGEATLDHLEGFARSRPVRIGNAAYAQRQLDTYGHVVEAAAASIGEEGLSPTVRRFVCEVVSRAARRWREADHGVWERRGQPAHYTASKLQCWVALERGIAIATHIAPAGNVTSWVEERDRIATWLEGAWDRRRGVFPSVPGSKELDASSLLFVLSGFLPVDSTRARQVVTAVEAELGSHGLLRRWSESEDGAFLPCTFWLAHALALIGEVDRAREVFDSAADCASDLGLLSEEADPETRAQLGNVPLAISHAGLVRAATAIEEAEQREASRGKATA
jgi:alpha,alpha-trehalase